MIHRQGLFVCWHREAQLSSRISCLRRVSLRLDRHTAWTSTLAYSSFSGALEARRSGSRILKKRPGVPPILGHCSPCTPSPTIAIVSEFLRHLHPRHSHHWHRHPLSETRARQQDAPAQPQTLAGEIRLEVQLRPPSCCIRRSNPLHQINSFNLPPIDRPPIQHTYCSP